MPNNTPNSDFEKQLVLEIEQANIAGTTISAKDAFTQNLLEYKETKLNNFKLELANKTNIWKQIEAQTKPNQKPNILTFVSSNNKMLKWAAAAVVVFAVLLSVVFNQYLDKPTLLAETGAAIETIQLADGSNVTLRPNTKLYSKTEKESKQVYQLEGEAFFDVTPNKNRTFSVQSDDGTVSVLGTRFNLSTWSDKMVVYLEEGSVRVNSNKHKDAITLKPGESAKAQKNKAPIQLNISADESTGWLSSMMYFNDRVASHVIAELEHHFNISIEITEQLENQSISGQLSLKELDTALDDLGLVLGGEFEITETQTYKFVSNE